MKKRAMWLACAGLVAMACNRQPATAVPEAAPVAAHDAAQKRSSAGKPWTNAPKTPANSNCAAKALARPGGPNSLVATGVCADAAQRATYGGFDQLRVWIWAVSTKHADGTPVVSQTDAQNDIATANLAFSKGGIQLVLAGYETSDTIPPKILDNSVGADPIYQSHPDALVALYVESYFDGGGVSWNNGTGLIVDRMSRTFDQILAHEVGHSLGLQHTDYCGTDVADGDGVADTPLDPGRGGYDCAHNAATGATCSSKCPTCPCVGVCTAPLAAISPDVNNIMTKYNDNWCTEYFTDGQFELMRCILRTQQKGRLHCLGSRQLCGDPVACVSLSTDQNCGSCGVVCKGNENCVKGACKEPCEEPCDPQNGGGCYICCYDCDGNPVCGSTHVMCSHIYTCNPHHQCP